MFRIVMMLAGLFLVAAGAAPATAGDAVQTQHVHVIVIDKMAFGPTSAGVRVGDIIDWVNHDTIEHRANARDGSFDVDLKPGASVRMRAKGGTVEFFCKFHPTMQATLVVK